MRFVLEKINKSFANQSIFKDLSVNFSHPGFYLISGKSGSGKTTLLNIIAGYEKYQSGKRICEDVHFAKIYQSYELIETLTVLENVRIVNDLYQETMNLSLFQKLGLLDIADHYPSELSGGQKQRVGIARALSQHPNMILCDEPTEALDIDNKEIVLKLLKDLSQTCVVIVVSHDVT